MVFKLIKDSISESLGLGTEKDRIEARLSNYRVNDVNRVQHEIALRNEVLGKIKMKIRDYERIKESNEKILKLCESIFNQAEQEVLKEGSEVQVTLYTKNNEVYLTANIAILREVIVRYNNLEEAMFYKKQLEQKVEPTIYVFIEMAIANKGMYNGTVDARGLYSDYTTVKHLIALDGLIDLNGKPLKPRGQGVSLLMILKKICEKNLGEVRLLLQKLYREEKNLNNQNLKGEYLLQTIENAKQVVRTSEEYAIAKASHDYIESIGRK